MDFEQSGVLAFDPTAPLQPAFPAGGFSPMKPSYGFSHAPSVSGTVHVDPYTQKQFEPSAPPQDQPSEVSDQKPPFMPEPSAPPAEDLPPQTDVSDKQPVFMPEPSAPPLSVSSVPSEETQDYSEPSFYPVSEDYKPAAGYIPTGYVAPPTDRPPVPEYPKVACQAAAEGFPVQHDVPAVSDLDPTAPFQPPNPSRISRSQLPESFTRSTGLYPSLSQDLPTESTTESGARHLRLYPIIRGIREQANRSRPIRMFPSRAARPHLRGSVMSAPSPAMPRMMVAKCAPSVVRSHQVMLDPMMMVLGTLCLISLFARPAPANSASTMLAVMLLHGLMSPRHSAVMARHNGNSSFEMQVSNKIGSQSLFASSTRVIFQQNMRIEAEASSMDLPLILPSI